MQLDLTTCQNRINQALDIFLSSITTHSHLLEALRYAVFNGGKRFRPFLVYCSGHAFHASLERLDKAAAAIELVHCYSLVHDDLPAMDNDDFRRGKPSCHRAFDEATAILVGDGLQTLAFECLADSEALFNDQPKVLLKMIHLLTKAIGPEGMIQGQMLDLQHQQKTLSSSQKETMQILKTGVLFSASLQLGALSSGDIDFETLKRLEVIGNHFGLAFQIQDDWNDQIQDRRTHSNSTLDDGESLIDPKDRLSALQVIIENELGTIEKKNSISLNHLRQFFSAFFSKDLIEQ